MPTLSLEFFKIVMQSKSLEHLIIGDGEAESYRNLAKLNDSITKFSLKNRDESNIFETNWKKKENYNNTAQVLNNIIHTRSNLIREKLEQIYIDIIVQKKMISEFESTGYSTVKYDIAHLNHLLNAAWASYYLATNDLNEALEYYNALPSIYKISVQPHLAHQIYVNKDKDLFAEIPLSTFYRNLLLLLAPKYRSPDEVHFINALFKNYRVAVENPGLTELPPNTFNSDPIIPSDGVLISYQTLITAALNTQELPNGLKQLVNDSQDIYDDNLVTELLKFPAVQVALSQEIVIPYPGHIFVYEQMLLTEEISQQDAKIDLKKLKDSFTNEIQLLNKQKTKKIPTMIRNHFLSIMDEWADFNKKVSDKLNKYGDRIDTANTQIKAANNQLKFFDGKRKHDELEGQFDANKKFRAI